MLSAPNSPVGRSTGSHVTGFSFITECWHSFIDSTWSIYAYLHAYLHALMYACAETDVAIRSTYTYVYRLYHWYLRNASNIIQYPSIRKAYYKGKIVYCNTFVQIYVKFIRKICFIQFFCIENCTYAIAKLLCTHHSFCLNFLLA